MQLGPHTGVLFVAKECTAQGDPCSFVRARVVSSCSGLGASAAGMDADRIFLKYDQVTVLVPDLAVYLHPSAIFR